MSFTSIILLTLVSMCKANDQHDPLIRQPEGLDITVAKTLKQLFLIASNEAGWSEKDFRVLQGIHNNMLIMVQEGSAQFVKNITTGPEKCRQNLDEIRNYVETRSKYYDSVAARGIIIDIKSNDAIKQCMANFAKNVDDIKRVMQVSDSDVNKEALEKLKKDMINARKMMMVATTKVHNAIARNQLSGDNIEVYQAEYDKCLKEHSG